MQLFLVAIIIFALDQITKQFALHFLAGKVTVPVISGIFHLTMVENQGIAFGMFQSYRTALLIAITVCVIALLIYFIRVPQSRLLHRICYGLILGGALGNLTDRIRVGYVVDFLDFRIWPVFNLADSMITIGVCLLILDTLRKGKHAS